MRSIFVAVLALALGLARHVHAFAPEELSGFAEGDPSERAAQVSAWAARGEPGLPVLLDRLEAGELLATPGGRLARLSDGRVRDLATDSVLSDPVASCEVLLLPNVLRASVEGARAILGLTSPDRQARLEAAAAIAAGDPDPAVLPLLEKALSTERDADVRSSLETAATRLALAAGDPLRRFAAAEALRDGSDAAASLKIVQDRLASGQESDTRVVAALRRSASSLEVRVWCWEMAGHLFGGLSLGSILVLVALGLAITYGLLGVINMAHGELVMVGAYTTYLVQGLFRSHLPGAESWYVVVAVPSAFVAAALVGIAIERAVLRHLYGRPLESLLATWGVSLVLIQTVRSLFGPQNVEVASPAWLSGSLAIQSNFTLPWNRLAIIAFAGAVLAATAIVLTRTRLGLLIRATTQNRSMARCVGVRTSRVDMLAFGLGSGLAGLAGVALSQVGNVGPDLGQGYIVDSFLVVVVGGVGQLAGSLWAGLGLGVLSKILEPTAGAVLAKIALLVLIILFIQKRPQGLFALKGRQAD